MARSAGRHGSRMETRNPAAVIRMPPLIRIPAVTASATRATQSAATTHGAIEAGRAVGRRVMRVRVALTSRPGSTEVYVAPAGGRARC
jgi:hypothetical protein